MGLLQALSRLTGGRRRQVDLAADGNGNLAVGGCRQAFRDSFGGSALKSDWLAVVDPAHTVVVAGNELAVIVGTAPNTETVLTLDRRLTLPCRVIAGIRATQRVAGQAAYLELVSVGDDGLPDGQDVFAWKLDGAASANTKAFYQYQVAGGAIGTSAEQTVGTWVTSAAKGGLFELAPDNEEMWWFYGTTDSTAGRTAGYVAHSNAPNPAREFVARLRFRNDPGFAGTATTYTVTHFVALDTAEVQAEITGGRGGGAAGQALSVAITSPLLRALADNGDAVAASSSANNLAVNARQYIFNGTGYDRWRLPSVFRTATATAAGNTAVWTPPAGKKFRLMRYRLVVTGNAAQAAGGTFNIELRDGASNVVSGSNLPAESVAVPVAAGSAGVLLDTGWCDLGNGLLGTTAAQALNVNLSAALTGGAVRVYVAGTEE